MAYVQARDWGHSYTDFLDLPIPVWWLEYNEKVRQNKFLEKNTSPVRQKSGASAAEWQRAHEEHKRKAMKNG